jgi:hypothetical protein
MQSKRYLTLLGVGLLFWLWGVSTAVVSAQSSDNNIGSIRGTVYLDRNRDGKCGAADGDPIQAGIPIEFVSNDGGFTTYLQSGSNGTYGLVAAGLGTWRVSARPNANDFVVTGTGTRQVFIGSEAPLALNVDFCVAPSTGQTGSTPSTRLPIAGADNSLSLLWLNLAFVVGLLFVGSGGMLLVRRQ